MPTLRNYINAELDRAYNKAAGGMLKSIKQLSTAPGSRIQARLAALEEEAQRLADDDKKIGIDNAEIIATVNEIGNLFNQTENLILANDNAVQESVIPVAAIATMATVALILNSRILPAGVNPLSAQAQKIYNDVFMAAGINWNGLDTTALRMAANYVESEAWIAKMNAWGDGYAELIADTIRKGILQGRSPINLSRDIRNIVENMPAFVSDRLTRTLQLTSFRDAEVVSSMANSDYIQSKVRRAVKDPRTCLSCIGLDGTIMQLNERIDDHYNGRCYATYILTNGQGDVGGQTGEEWFNSLSPERQAQQASFQKNKAKYEAWKAGEFKLSELTGEHKDNVFGLQTFEKSLKQILGEAAKGYYGK